MRMFGFACVALAVTLGLCPAVARADAAAGAFGADQVVGLFGDTCLHFAGDVAGMRGFLSEQKAPPMAAGARDVFLAGRRGEVFDVSIKTAKLALISLDDGGCEAVVDQADPAQVLAILKSQAAENGAALAPLGTQAPPRGQPGVRQVAFGITMGGKTMHILVSIAPTPPQAVLTFVPN